MASGHQNDPPGASIMLQPRKGMSTVIGPVLRRLRVVTTADYFKIRYNQSVAVLYSLIAIVILMLNMGTMLLGSSRVVEAISGNAISFNVAIFIMTALFLLYGIAGGLVAAIINDFLQGILTFAFSFLLLPFGLKAVGGFEGLHEKLDGMSTDMFSMVLPGDVTQLVVPVLAHRLALARQGADALEESAAIETILRRLLSHLPEPV